MEKWAESAPPVIANDTVWDCRSASVAVTVATAVVFSATLWLALDVNTGEPNVSKILDSKHSSIRCSRTTPRARRRVTLRDSRSRNDAL